MIYINSLGNQSILLVSKQFFLIRKSILAPLKKYGEGNYQITSVLEVDTPTDFDELDESVKKCQNEISYEECVTKSFLGDVISKCQCIPFELWTNKAKV